MLEAAPAGPSGSRPIWCGILGPLLPAVLRDGFFFGAHVPERLAVFIDYQNVDLTAHNLSLPTKPVPSTRWSTRFSLRSA